MSIVDFDAEKGAALAALNEEAQARRVGLLNLARAHIDGAQQARKSALLIERGYVGPQLGSELAQAQTLDTRLAGAGRAVLALLMEWEEQA
jgi:hypothetical protein